MQRPPSLIPAKAADPAGGGACRGRLGRRPRGRTHPGPSRSRGEPESITTGGDERDEEVVEDRYAAAPGRAEWTRNRERTAPVAAEPEAGASDPPHDDGEPAGGAAE